jgi:transcriptional regulator with XRE-family HTH domain
VLTRQRCRIGYHADVARVGPAKTAHVTRLAGNLLRIVRARSGMSQRELADAAGVPQSTIARIESGARQPSLPLLTRILAAADLELRISIDDYDSHDDVLDACDVRRTGAQRAARRASQEVS